MARKPIDLRPGAINWGALNDKGELDPEFAKALAAADIAGMTSAELATVHLHAFGFVAVRQNGSE